MILITFRRGKTRLKIQVLAFMVTVGQELIAFNRLERNIGKLGNFF
jgi:hypothetical protein